MPIGTDGPSDSARGPGAVVRAYLAAARSGDWDTAMGFVAEDVAFRIPGRSRFAGEHRGREAARRYIDSVRAIVHSGDVEIELVDVLESSERVALIVRERLVLDDRTVDIRRANVYRVADGRIVEIWVFEADQYDVDALLA